MNVGFFGYGPRAPARRRVLTAQPDLTCVEAADVHMLLDRADVLFIAAGAGAVRCAEAAAKRGVHVFLEKPPASARHCDVLARRAEEAGVEIGVSRPLRFHPALTALPEGAAPRLIVLQLPLGAAAWPAPVAEALDLCCALAGSHGVRRIDAEAARSTSAQPVAMAFDLRFHSGAYAQAQLRRGRAGAVLYAAGLGFQLDADLDGAASWLQQDEGPFERIAAAAPPPLEAETRAFLDALREGRPAPVSALDVRHTMRLVGRLLQRMR